MGYEALITINCGRYSKKITDFILLLDKLNWKIHNDKGSVEYLPVGDNDAFAWQSEKLSIKEVFDIINQKQENNELVGIDLLYKGTECGMSLLARNMNDIMLDLDIERKILVSDTFNPDFQKAQNYAILVIQNNSSIEKEQIRWKIKFLKSG